MRLIALAIVIGAGLIAASQFRLVEITTTGKEWVYRTNRITGEMSFCLAMECQPVKECRIVPPSPKPEPVATATGASQGNKRPDMSDEFEQRDHLSELFRKLRLEEEYKRRQEEQAKRLEEDRRKPQRVCE